MDCVFFVFFKSISKPSAAFGSSTSPNHLYLSPICTMIHTRQRNVGHEKSITHVLDVDEFKRVMEVGVKKWLYD